MMRLMFLKVNAAMWSNVFGGARVGKGRPNRRLVQESRQMMMMAGW